MRRRILMWVLSGIMVLSMTALLGGCGPKEEPVTQAVVTSTDGGYDFHATDKGLAWISAAGKDEKLLEGSIKVREENSAVTITLEGDIMTVVEEPASISFTWPIDGKDVTFVIQRGELMEDLGFVGVVLNTSAKPKNEAAGGDPFSAGSMASGLLFWNDGRVQTMLMKIQSTHDYTYSASEGLKINTTAEQEEQYGKLWIESYDETEGVYTLGYDLTVPLPPFLANPGTLTVTDAQLRSAFGE